MKLLSEKGSKRDIQKPGLPISKRTILRQGGGRDKGCVLWTKTELCHLPQAGQELDGARNAVARRHRN
jgi:hypothetical protein